MRHRLIMATLSLVAMAIMSACGANGLTATPVGDCAANGGTGFRLEASGLTPNGEYQTVATYPDGRPYDFLAAGGRGRADDNGAAPDWTWNCQNGVGGRPDPAGNYRVTIIDLTTADRTSFQLSVEY